MKKRLGLPFQDLAVSTIVDLMFCECQEAKVVVLG